MGVRAGHVAGAAAVSLALLLLLSYYSAEPPPLAQSLPRVLQPVAEPGNRTAPPAQDRTGNSTHALETAQHNKTSPPPAPSQRRNATGGAVLTRELYVAGHSHPHPELCPALGQRLKLMIFVTSAPSHSEARAGVRLTWGHFAARSDVALAFLIGSTRQGAVAATLEEEDQLYGDIVRGNFEDSYSNLTLKTLSMLEWVDSYCPRARHILKTDDDMFVNVPRLLKFAASRSRDTRTIYGKVVRKWGPNRSTKSKYYVSRAQFAGKIFPDFATGPAYLLTADCVRPLYERALTQPFVRLEDVFVTGVVAQQLGIARRHAPEFYNKKLPPHPCTVQRAISLHMVRYPDQFDLWRKLLDHKSKCANT